MDDQSTEPPRSEAPETNEAVLEAGRQPVHQPIFNVPPAIMASLALLTGIFLVQTYLLSPQVSEAFVVRFGFSPVRYVVPFADQGLEWLWSPVTYSFLHGGIEHIVFNSLWLAAFGTPVLRRIGTPRFVIFWIGSAAAGALLHALLNWGQPTLMIGASAVVSALMGAACRFAFARPSGHSHISDAAPPRLSVLGALSQRTVLVFTGAWLFGNLAIAVGLPLFGDLGAAVAWDAHIGGFLFGFLLFGLFDPVPAPAAR